jgi:hypothetical protein
MKSWLFLFLTLMLQEPITSGGVIFHMYEGEMNVYLIHATFLLATVIDILIGYGVGWLIREKTFANGFVTYVHKKASHYKMLSRGTFSKRMALFIFGPIIFPITAFFTPLIGFSFYESLIILLLGEIVFWYGPEWLLVFSLDTYLGSHLWIISVSLLTLFALISFIKNRVSQKEK